MVVVTNTGLFSGLATITGMLAAVGHVSSFHGHFLYTTLTPTLSEELASSENITSHSPFQYSDH